MSVLRIKLARPSWAALLGLALLAMSGCAHDFSGPGLGDGFADWGKDLRSNNKADAPFWFSSTKAREIDRSLGGGN